MTTHVPRNRRKGREHLDQPQAAPVQAPAPQPTTTPDDFAAFDAMYSTDDDLDRMAQDRKADDRKKADDVKRQAQHQAVTATLDYARRDDGADRRRQAEEAARKRRQAEEKHRQEVAAETRQTTSLRNEAQTTAATKQAKKRTAAADRKPVEVFDKIKAQAVADTLEGATKLSIFGAFAAFARGMKKHLARVVDYVRHYVTPPVPAFPAMPMLARSLPVPEAVMAPSSEKKPKPAPAGDAPAPAFPKMEFVPKTDADRDWLARKDWNPGHARKDGLEIYGSVSFYNSVARSLERGFVGPLDEETLEPKAPYLLKLLQGEYGQEALDEARKKFETWEHRLRDDVHAAYKITPSLMDRAAELERTPTPDPDLDDTPTDPPNDGAPVAEASGPKAAKSPEPTPAPAPKPSTPSPMRRTM
ncbi:hypothetical protein [Aureimonas psammosilenae]|uniref:hypothetical protein n=1 Tax=Aureimonas psammosilenae TaxID=2495496 RepID=UPI001261020D|nr:hypothetical protein [Aureimonas psammosilenae]